MHRSLVILPLIGIIAVSCGDDDAPSRAPIATEMAFATHAPTPARASSQAPASPSASVSPTIGAVGGWPFFDLSSREDPAPVFGPDGAVYLLAGWRDSQNEYQRRVVALDASGNVKHGWPIDEPPGADFGSLAVGPDGTVYFEECGRREVGCVVHRLDERGQELPGWPFELPPALACPTGGLCGFIVDVEPSGSVYLAHWREGGGLQVISIDASGEPRLGWLVAPDNQPDNQVGWWIDPQVGTDGTLFVLGQQPDGRATSPSLAAYSPDGSLRPGWPVILPDNSTYALGPDGTVVVWSLIDNQGELCSEPRRTVFTVLGSDGHTLAGWPRGSQGHASPPVVAVDGTVYYVSDLGNVYAHARTGEVKPGWPVAVPRAIGWCNRLSPYLAPDGTIYVLGYDEMSDLPGAEVRALAPDGVSRPGWPYRPEGELVGPTLDTDGGGMTYPPVFGLDGTVHFVTFDTRGASVSADVVAVDRAGQVKTGWPYRLPIDPAAGDVASLSIAPDGKLFVRGGGMLIALDPDGSVSE